MNINLPKEKNWVWYLEWVASFILITGISMTAMNFYPYNLFFTFVGNAGWIIVAIVWKRYSILSYKSLVAVIFGMGIIKYLLKVM